ncbi:MAG: methylmalonyl Co-A mutase-associated GTPase MeaB [Prevotellaceae bacterium]|jgi:LAO/AO transport system kinase|nr:methylmalonyl Co-A mutase-associated GTPase MeaB [Prevotellaceae bacterium]
MTELLKTSALTVNPGVEQPPLVNPEALKRIAKNKKKSLTVEQYVKGIVEGNITILGRAITLVESLLDEHQEMAQAIVEKCLPLSGNSVRIGITGVPGAGKSTFIEAFGKKITSVGHKLAVLAIDPSSERSKGSILGDKTRMLELSCDANAFIRPSPSAGSLGGVARKTRETVILCEAAGFDTIFIETVGVGQSETAVHSMVDFFLLLMISGAGDELQGIKRGIMEMADMIVINKADGSNVEKAMQAKAQYQSAMHLFPPPASGWTPKVMTVSSIAKTGLAEVWDAIGEYVQTTRSNGFFLSNRREQTGFWMHETIRESLQNNFYSNPQIQLLLSDCEKQVAGEEISSFVAAKKLLDRYFELKNHIKTS